MTSGVPVLIADSQRLFSRSLAWTLEKTGGFEVVDTTPETGLETLKLLADPAMHCELVILDYWIRGMSGPATTRIIRRAAPAPRVVLTGWFHTPVEINEAFRSGASAFVSKSVGFSEFHEVIRRVTEGDPRLLSADGDEGIRMRSGRPPAEGDEGWERLLMLTVREIEVLSLLSFAPVEKVAKELSISLGTLRNHIYNILRKTEARSQIEAIDIVRRVGLIDS